VIKIIETQSKPPSGKLSETLHFYFGMKSRVANINQRSRIGHKNKLI